MTTGTSRPTWMGIELRHLVALAAVAREGSFRGAADSLGYVQSAISQQLAQLEQLVGGRLIERRRGVAGVALTESGELLLDHVDDVMSKLRAAQADLEALAAGRAGRLRVGVSETAATRLMPPILRKLGRRLPEVRVEIDESRSASRLAELVEIGALDMALTDSPPHPGPLAQREVICDARVLLVPSGWPQADAPRPPRPEELAELPLIGPASDDTVDELEVLLRVHGVEPRYVLRTDIAGAVQAHVAAGIGAAVVPRLMIDESDERTAIVQLADLLPQRVTALYWHSDRRPSPAMTAFAEIAIAVAAEQVTGALPAAA